MTSPVTYNLVIREVIDSDLPIFFEHQSDPVSVEMVGLPSRDKAAFDAHWIKIRADEANMQRTLVVDGQVAGNFMSFPMQGVREVGYRLGREYWGKGLATAALAIFLRDHEHRRPLYGHTAPHNLASVKVLQKNGFIAQLCVEGDDWILRLD